MHGGTAANKYTRSGGECCEWLAFALKTLESFSSQILTKASMSSRRRDPTARVSRYGGYGGSAEPSGAGYRSQWCLRRRGREAASSRNNDQPSTGRSPASRVESFGNQLGRRWNVSSVPYGVNVRPIEAERLNTPFKKMARARMLQGPAVPAVPTGRLVPVGIPTNLDARMSTRLHNRF